MKPSRLLLPLVPLYRSALALRELRLRTGMEPVRRLRYPVVSIGNLSTGGSGKTPLTIALARLLSGKGLHVDVLARGYGRQSRVATRVNPAGTAVEFGDEPLLITRAAGVPVFVAPERYEAGLLAEAESPPADQDSPSMVHLLDDGFQHRQLAREFDILLFDQHDWRDRLLPAGNLREPLKAARRASVIAIPVGELEAELRSWGWRGPVWRLRRTMETPAVNGPIAAFCGIARPEPFFAGLEAAGLRLAARFAYPDHHPYSVADVDHLANAAQSAGAVALVTTEKDLVRLEKFSAAFPPSLPLLAARLTIEIEDPSTALDWLIDRVRTAPAHPKL